MIEDIDYYLNYDHKARAITTLMSVIAGTLSMMAVGFSGFSDKVAVTLGVCVIGAIEIWRVVSYKRTK